MFGLLVCPCVSGVVWSVCVPCGVLWCCGFVLVFGCCCFFLPRLLCAFLLLLCGVASVWPVLSWLRPPLVLPTPSVGSLVPSGPVSVLLVPPSAAFMDLSNLSLTQDEQNQVNTKEEETSNTSHLRTRRYTLAKMWQGRRPRTISQGLRADRTTRRRAAKHRHSTRRRDKQKTEATREERPGQAEGDRQAD